jgi:hypothetical protein
MAQSYKTIVVEKRGAADWLTFNRPDVLNALSLEMVDELSHYFGNLYNDRSVRVVVIRGAGRAFCAGLDIKDRNESDPGADPYGGGFGFQGYLADVYVKMRRCPQPIIALVHGAACGGGLTLARASDIRIAGERAREVGRIAEEVKAQEEFGVNVALTKEEQQLVDMAEDQKRYQKEISELRKEELEIIADENLTAAEKTLRRRMIQVQRDKAASEFNKEFFKNAK